MKRKKFLFFLIVLSNLILSGCWDSREINRLAITIGMGIDKTDNGYILSQQILNPKAIFGKRPTNESPIVIYSEEGKDLFELKRKITTHCPRKIFNSHLRVVVLSEAAATTGIEDILDFLIRGHEYRTDYYFVIAKGNTAKNILSTLTPLETIPGLELFDSLTVSENVWAPVKTMKIIELSNSIISEGINPVITGIEITSGNGNPNSIESLKLTEQTDRLKFTSLGVFKKDKLVGWLSEDQSKGYNYIVGNVKNTVGYVEYQKQKKVTFEVTKAESKIKASLLNDKPVINVDIEIETDVGVSTGDLDVSKEENIDKLIKIIESRITNFCYSAIDKTKNDFKTDIFGFGEAVHRSYPNLWEQIKGNWDNKFVNLPVNVNVKTKTNKLGQITKPLITKGNE